MKTQHTPGPWRVDPYHCSDVQTEDGAIEICLAEGGEPYGENLFSVPSYEESFANARLIAAAPDLLEALKWYVKTDEVDNSEGNEFWLEGKAKAIAAIAKATGSA